MRTVIQNLAAAAIVGIVTLTAAGQTPKHPGIELYNQGKIDQAIASLEGAAKQKEYRENAEIWNTLGLSYFAKNDFKRAARAFEFAVKLSPDTSAFHANLAFLYLLTQKPKDARQQADRAIALNPRDAIARVVLGRLALADENFEAAEAEAGKIVAADAAAVEGYVLRADILLARLGKSIDAGWEVRDELDLLKQASETLKTGADLSKGNPNHKDIQDEAEAVSAFYQYFSHDPAGRVPISSATQSNVTRLTITSKPAPQYTERARAAHVGGRIRVAVLFGSDGRIRHTLLLGKLGSGLDESALDAARRISFVPQSVDGKPVSVVKIVEYSFRVY